MYVKPTAPLETLLLCHSYTVVHEAGLALSRQPRKIADQLMLSVQVFMNIVLDEAFEEKAGGEKVAIGMIVRSLLPPKL
jgi:hypothetical protein